MDYSYLEGHGIVGHLTKYSTNIEETSFLPI